MRSNNIRLHNKLFWSTLRSLNRREELRRLALWASQKRLKGPGRRYRELLLKEEALLRHDYGIKVFSGSEPSEDSDGAMQHHILV